MEIESCIWCWSVMKEVMSDQPPGDLWRPVTTSTLVLHNREDAISEAWLHQSVAMAALARLLVESLHVVLSLVHTTTGSRLQVWPCLFFLFSQIARIEAATTTRIVGGSNADPLRYPYQATVVRSVDYNSTTTDANGILQVTTMVDTRYCGGSLMYVVRHYW